MMQVSRVLVFLLLLCLFRAGAQGEMRPNVILIMADDQGYGDLGAHGHPFIRTPHLDALWAESVRFTDFHVAPMCTPTRGQLMTGLDAMRNGATAVCQGRSMIRREIPTVADVFRDAGYRTILSGKWHLGDSFPHRPQDRGFEEVLTHRAWGVPSLASHWSNSPLNLSEPTDAYHDPVLEHNGVDTRYAGYVTDVLFDHALEQIRTSRNENRPFFLYLATPTPHVPNISPAGKLPYYQALDPYEGKKVHSEYYGMIENIDDNLGRLEALLEEEGIKDQTILIYLSDNGTQSRWAGALYNAGMRDKKRSVYEGGHRVPLLVRWPSGHFAAGTDVEDLTQVQDLMPTLMSLCGIAPDLPVSLDGLDLSPLLRGQPWSHAARILIVQYMVGGRPWEPAVAMQGPWRFLKNSELYNIRDDPGQSRNLTSKHPEVAERLRQAYAGWYEEVHLEFLKPRYLDLGHPDVPVTVLYANDWDGDYCDNPGGLRKGKARGVWHVDVIRPGRYRIELSRWPFEAGKPLTEGVTGSPGDTSARPIASAALQIHGQTWRSPVPAGASMVVFEVDLPAGRTELNTRFLDAAGAELSSAFFTRVTWLEEG